MKIHEYQAKELFRKYSIPVPEGGIAFNPEEAKKVAERLNGFPVVIKAQIHAGGRGQGGGVKLARSMEETERLTGEMIGMALVTHQTGPKGKRVGKVLIEQGLDIVKEFYISVMPDRATAKHVVMASEAGGMDIEAVAAQAPEKIIKVFIDPLLGIRPYHCRETAYGLGIGKEETGPFVNLLINLYSMFVETDCSLAEVNPLVLTAERGFVALDAKVDIDGNALFRQKDLLAYRDPDEEDPLEIEASKYNLNYINLGEGGNVGNMVNGAGLAMATMDIIKLAGARPANFLDLGGTADAEAVENGFRIMLKDKNVKGILINVFGGILRCDVLAEGVIQAAEKTGLHIPVIVRMEGNNVELGRKILSESGLNLTTAADLKDAAQKVSEMIR
jgi:succinyl-CoA synthetase beta subunit